MVTNSAVNFHVRDYVGSVDSRSMLNGKMVTRVQVLRCTARYSQNAYLMLTVVPQWHLGVQQRHRVGLPSRLRHLTA